MAKARKPKKAAPKRNRAKAEPQPEPEAKPQSTAKRTNAELAYDFMQFLEQIDFGLWIEEHEHEQFGRRRFIYLLEKGTERTETNDVKEYDLYEALGQWCVRNATPKSRKETQNVLAELLWLLPKKRFKNSPYCVPEVYRNRAQ